MVRNKLSRTQTRKSSRTQTRKSSRTQTRKPSIKQTRKPSRKQTRKPSIKQTRKSNRNQTRKPSIKQTRKSNRNQTRKSNRNQTRKSKSKSSSFSMKTTERHVSNYYKSSGLVDLSNLPHDVLYSISKSLTPRERMRLTSTNKSIRKASGIIHKAPLGVIEINTTNQFKEYLDYFKFLLSKNNHIERTTFNISKMVNNASMLEKWINTVHETVGDVYFNKIKINIGELQIDDKYKCNFDYTKHRNISVDILSLYDVDANILIDLLNQLEFMNIERVFYFNETKPEYIDICQYLCKVKTVRMTHPEWRVRSNINFDYFSRSGSKTKNIRLFNFTLNRHDYFNGMNCVYIGENKEIVGIYNISDVKYLVAFSTFAVEITASHNIDNLIVYSSDHKFPLIYITENTTTNLHIINPSNRNEELDIKQMKEYGMNVITHDKTYEHPVLKIFNRF